MGLGLLTLSCTTDFDPYIETEPIPVVYGVINPQDSLYQVRLTKSYVGPGSAYDYAQLADSLYFEEANVYLETFLHDQSLVQSIKLEPVEIAPREPGIFLTVPNRIYQTDETQLLIRPEHFQEMGRPYNAKLYLRAQIPGSPDTVLASTWLREPPRIINPRSTFQKVYFYGEVPFQMEWVHSSKDNYYEIQVVMRYREVLYDGTEREAQVDWVLSGIHYNEQTIPGGSNHFYAYYFRPENFYSQVRAAIKINPEVKGRVIRNLDFVIMTSDKTIQNYVRMGEIADDYRGATYSNVANGQGIFTSFNTTGVYNLRLGYRELDSLAYGQYTKHLNFKNWD